MGVDGTGSLWGFATSRFVVHSKNLGIKIDGSLARHGRHRKMARSDVLAHLHVWLTRLIWASVQVVHSTVLCVGQPGSLQGSGFHGVWLTLRLCASTDSVHSSDMRIEQRGSLHGIVFRRPWFTRF